MNRGRRQGLYSVGLALLISPVFAPQLLAFPYRTTIAAHVVYSETPIEPRLTAIIAAADARVARSPIAGARASDQRIFLTTGGWRWTWLSIGQHGTFALTRPFSETVTVTRSNLAANLVLKGDGGEVGGHRSLDDTIAHEMTHTLIRAHFGITADARYPVWLREGIAIMSPVAVVSVMPRLEG